MIPFDVCVDVDVLFGRMNITSGIEESALQTVSFHIAYVILLTRISPEKATPSSRRTLRPRAWLCLGASATGTVTPSWRQTITSTSQ
jgi:hypothetical protein